MHELNANTTGAPAGYDQIMSALGGQAFGQRPVRTGSPAGPGGPGDTASAASFPALSHEQQRLLDVVTQGRDVIVEATVGAGKTTAIQALCEAQPPERSVLYLTYSKLLKADAQRRVHRARVQNYHGVVYPALLKAGIRCGISESIAQFNANFRDLSADFPRYDLLVVDEYQDINEEYAQLLRNIKSLNPLMQTVMVGDMAQKVRADTTLDVQHFAQTFCESPELVPFTQSFRVGPELGTLLGEAWNKPVVGINTAQTVRYMTFSEAQELVASSEPGQLLCLGKRNGAMAEMLNRIEESHPEKFNKDTVYASIRDGDASVTYGDDAAVFTTFDASKGLERHTAVVFDYDEQMWEMRNSFPNADPEVLRNVFLVAASRGKNQVVFVKGVAPHTSGTRIGFIRLGKFTDLPEVSKPTYPKPMWASDCFDFKYAENIEACFDLLKVDRLDDGTDAVVDLDRTDGLIDLSPAVGHYQEALYFDGYDPRAEVEKNPKPIAAAMLTELNDDVWHNSLLLTAVDTEQYRYADQVKRTIPPSVAEALVSRLSSQLPSTAQVQVPLSLAGEAVQSRSERTRLVFEGVADVIHDDEIVELKFVSELSHPMFLQLGLYLVMGEYESGVLWNVRTGERWRVRVPDRQRFMNAVTLAVTKQSYRVFETARTGVL